MKRHCQLHSHNRLALQQRSCKEKSVRRIYWLYNTVRIGRMFLPVKVLWVAFRKINPRPCSSSHFFHNEIVAAVPKTFRISDSQMIRCKKRQLGQQLRQHSQEQLPSRLKTASLQFCKLLTMELSPLLWKTVAMISMGLKKIRTQKTHRN